MSESAVLGVWKVGREPTDVIENDTNCRTASPTKFIVEVQYREPSYEIHNGARAEPYRFRYRLEAPSEQAAITFAVAEFERMQALSSVGWTRSIVGIIVEQVIDNRK